MDTTEKLWRDRALIEALIDDPSRLGPDLQPLKDLTSDAVVGWKATGSGQRGTDLDSTLALLVSAQSTGLLERLDWSFRCLAFEAFAASDLTGELHLTPEPDTFGSPCPPRLATTFGRARRALRIAAEVHDEAFAHPGLEAAVAEWRGWGWRVVVSDVAHLADAALLRRLDLLRPDVVSVDVSRPANARLEELLAWAGVAGVELHATGVDSDAGRRQALALGATVGRGRLLGGPSRLP